MHTPLLIQHLFRSVTWRIPSSEKRLYITFDDGPIPEVTPWVLQTLNDFNATATFFCVGENVRKNPDVMKMITSSKHKVGNHTMHHLNGWSTENKKYYADINECRKQVNSALFRPPYGKLRLSQMNHLKKDFRIIMWDVLSRDYDASLSGEKCFDIVKNNAKPGSIIVFHDSIKAEKRLRIALPATLKYFSEQGYSFDAIP